MDPAAVAVLLDSGGTPFALVEDFGGGEVALTALVALEVPESGSLQVWTKWCEEVGPVSLGVLDAFAGAVMGADGLPDPVAGQLYEITLGAEGGSATSRPQAPSWASSGPASRAEGLRTGVTGIHRPWIP
jgi:anti-sigma-K factor RskA